MSKVCPLLSIAIAVQMAAEGCYENPYAVCIGENCMFCENRYKDHPICKISSQPCNEAREAQEASFDSYTVDGVKTKVVLEDGNGIEV